MKAQPNTRPAGQTESSQPSDILRALKNHYAALRDMRRGICLLNAGEYAQAEAAFKRAAAAGLQPGQLPRLLAACALGRGDTQAAAEKLDVLCDAPMGRDVDAIRFAYALWSTGKPRDGIARLREALRSNPENAELHFQLGVLLGSVGEAEEAELRFTQVESIDRQHVEGLVQLALCCAARHAPGEALGYLQRALALRPHDPRIGMLAAQAARAVQQQGHLPALRAIMPEASVIHADAGIAELAQAVANDPDFVDAFLSLPSDEVEPDTFAMLLRTLELALERQPEQAELHFHCGQVLSRIGRRDDAIARNERALALRPRYTRALVELARLYQLTNRNDDALTRLRESIAAGAEYADVYYMLGNVHRARGEVAAARRAYQHALAINARYRDAQLALESLAA